MKFQSLRLALLGTVTLSVVACSGMKMAPSGGDDQASFQDAMQQAEQAYKKVTDAEGAWSTTEEVLADAKDAAAKADFTTALTLAKLAKFESDMALEQHESQKNAGPTLF